MFVDATHPLAQLGAAPEWVYALGGVVLILGTLLGTVLVGIKVWKELRGGPSEPLHNPSVDKKIGDTVERSETRTARLIGQSKAEAHHEVVALEEKMIKEITHLHGRVSGLRGELREDYKSLEDKVQAGVDRMNETFAKTVERMAAVETNTASQERRIIAHESKLDRHIEKGCPALDKPQPKNG